MGSENHRIGLSVSVDDLLTRSFSRQDRVVELTHGVIEKLTYGAIGELNYGVIGKLTFAVI